MINLKNKVIKNKNVILKLAGTMTESEADELVNSIYQDKYNKKCASCNRNLYNYYPNLRLQFPILKTKLNGHNLIYLDSAATSQKPQQVIDAISDFYSHDNASSHSVHSLGGRVTEMVEQTRLVVADFIGSKVDEVVFTSGATEGINLVANGFLEASLKYKKGSYDSPFVLNSDDEILICVDQHHSNILPWQRLAELIGCKIVFFGILDSGLHDLQDFESKLNNHTKIIAISNVSNVIGVIQDLEKINSTLKERYTVASQQPLDRDNLDLAHSGTLSFASIKMTNLSSIKPIIVLDATQSVSHFKVNVKELDVDFMVFSGHKIYGPTGVGVLYGKQDLFEQLPNYKVGGDMVESVTLKSNIYKQSPFRFEAGTVNFASIIGLKAALNWFIRSQDQIIKIDKDVFNYLNKKLLEIPNLKILGCQNLYLDSKDIKLNNQGRIPLVSFYIEDINPLDLALLLDQKGICIRSGQHCAGILHEYLGIDSSCRVSLACFNTFDEIDFLTSELKHAINVLR